MRWAIWLVALAVTACTLSENSAAHAQASTPAAAATTSNTKVWINTASRVYHCPGTRWYAATKSGELVTERDAIARGYRVAAGKPCDPALSAAVDSLSAEIAVAAAAGKVWVNTPSGVYHCPNTRWYGVT